MAAGGDVWIENPSLPGAEKAWMCLHACRAAPGALQELASQGLSQQLA